MTSRKAALRAMSMAVLAIALLLMSSCVGNTLHHQYIHIDRAGWNRNDTLVFNVKPATSNGMYCVSTEIRTTASFPYKELCMVRELLVEKPLSVRKDTIRIDTGTRGILNEGRGVTLMTFSVDDSTLTLIEGQKCRVKMYHIMSREQLPHIVDIGIKIGAIH